MVNTERSSHKQFEARLIQLLRWRFEKSNFRVVDHLKVGDLPLVDVSEVTITALVHHLTSGIEEALHKMKFKPISPGIYRRDAEPPAYVISFTALPDELLPEELQAFSDSARRRHIFLSSLGNKEKTPLVEAIFDLYESEVKKIMLNIREESLKNVFSVVPPEKIIAALGDEKVIAALGDARVIAAL